jgi:pimeloyl-ACP methyl ester carboxylesterase
MEVAMDIVLVPGLWLDGPTWERVVPLLEKDGHRPRPLTLPGLESVDTDRSAIGLADQVAAVVAAVDAAPPEEKVLLVGHSAGSGIAYGALDRRPDRVARAVYIGGWPTPDGEPVAGGFPTEGGDLAMPPFSEFDSADLLDMDDADLAAFRARAIPSPARLATDLQQLTDERRYDVPATLVCPEFRASDIQQWIAGGEPSLVELTRIRDLTYVDLPTGHWPQLTKPEELVRVLLEAAERG